MAKNILITGGCGFIGSNLAVRLSDLGYKVTCLDNLSRRGSEILMNRILERGCNFIHGDIRNMEDLNKLKDEYQILLECSAEPSVLIGTKGDEARFLINNNLTGSINCFEFARERKISIIFFSTSRVYPYNRITSFEFKEEKTRFVYNDIAKSGVSKKGISTEFSLDGVRSLYGATKLASEYLLKEYSENYSLHSIINRCGVIAGPWQLGKVDQGVFTYWLVCHYFKNNLSYIGFGGKGKQVRDLLHIDDLGDLIIKQINKLNNYRGQIFNVGGGIFSDLSLLETTNLCQTITGNQISINSSIPNRPFDVIWYITDNTMIKKEFEWVPQRDGKTILEDIYNWLNNNQSIVEKIFKR